MRLDKFIGEMKNISRSDVKKLISKGKVCVNGSVVKSSSIHINEKNDNVLLDGQEVVNRPFIYIMLNKPAGVVCASRDKQKTVFDILPDDLKRKNLFVAGRLDKDTHGFVLITNDGEFAHNILSPKKHVEKEYLVKTEHDNFSGYKEKFESGLPLCDFVCKPAKFIKTGYCTCKVKISEGKFHQIKKMFSALGNKVVYLKRIAMGGVYLDDSLDEGMARQLTENELKKLKKE